MSNSEQEKQVLDRAPHQLLIGGEWRDASGGATLPVEDPSTGESLCEIADATPEDAQAAIDAAAEAQPAWAATAPNERSEILYRAFEALTAQADDLALLMTLEMGKAVAESKAEIAYAAEFFRWFSGEALRIDGYYKTAGNAASRVLVMRQPIGPSYFITPWNFPNAMGTRKIGPAIAAGCTMVAKPAQQTPLSMLALAKLLERVRPAARGPERGHRQVFERDLEADHRRPAAEEALLHRLDRGRQEADRPGRRQRAQGLDGARRQRAVSDLRRRRRRRRGRGRDDRQDAKRRRGLRWPQTASTSPTAWPPSSPRSSPRGWAR